MKCVVTGASGLVGRALVASLARRGDEVTVVTRRPAELPGAAREVVVPDICGAEWHAIVPGAEVVYHLAAHVHITDRQKARDLARFRAVNVDATAALARACATAGTRRLVFMSTVAVHGVEASEQPLTEASPLQPVTAYGISKLEAEEQLRSAAGSMEWSTLRAPLVYGPHVRAKFLQLMRLVDQGLPLPFGRVRNRRSLLYAGNLVDAMIVVASSPNAANGTFLVADEETWSTPDLIRALAADLGVPARLMPISGSVASRLASIGGARRRLDPLVSSLILDTSHLRETVGWRPPLPARLGFRETVRWYRSRSGSA